MMKRFELLVEPLKSRVAVLEGQTILQALQTVDIHIPADCGGEGLCRHCQVLLLDGQVEQLDPERWWSEAEGEHEWILACQARPLGNLTIRLSPQSLAGDLVALSTIAAGRALLEDAVGECYWPLAQTIDLALSPPTSDDNEPDFQRLERGLTALDAKLPPIRGTLGAMQRMSAALRENEFRVRATVADRGPCREIIDLLAGDTDGPTLGIAVDIGTSTVVVQSVELEHAQLQGKASATNAQARYGADVITRAIWAEENEDGPARMQQIIAEQVSGLVEEACAATSCEPSQVMAASLAGNATMLTFMLGADPRPIRRDPHIPLARELPTFHASELGLRICPDAPVFLTPAVSGFVGGDITAGVLATGMAHSDELSLLVDVGTNGEIVLGNRDWLMCCSCSAGPAFEGVDIEAGVHAVPGAIESIEYDAVTDSFEWETIAGQPPIGLCGTGLLEALATMFRAGILDRSGNLDPTSGTPRIRDGEYEPEILIADGDETSDGSELVLRESEVENLMRSKGAVYAGIYCLLDALSLDADMIDRVYIAGAFGNRLQVEEAVTIGMLPDVQRDRITFAGNTSLAGAYLALLCRQARDQLAEIAGKMTYMELSVTPNFMDEFVAALFLPHTDLSRFPSQQ